MAFDTADTIVAISSPPGAAARGIVRIAGTDAFSLAARVFHAESGEALIAHPAGRRILGDVLVDGSKLPATVYLFGRPHSYTGSDLVELHLLGAPGVLALLLDELVKSGARRAGPGEFTARAYLAGTMDLTSAMGVAATIAAQSDAELQAARRLIRGDLAQQANSAR